MICYSGVCSGSHVDWVGVAWCPRLHVPPQHLWSQITRSTQQLWGERGERERVFHKVFERQRCLPKGLGEFEQSAASLKAYTNTQTQTTFSTCLACVSMIPKRGGLIQTIHTKTHTHLIKCSLAHRQLQIQSRTL